MGSFGARVAEIRDLAAAILNPGRVPGEAENDPIAFLRKFSNYLAPKLGIFSADFWVIFTIWIRNMLLNLLILIPFLASLVALAILVAPWAAGGAARELVWESPRLCCSVSRY